ncbi:hypothetical protein RvY_08417 [Ramazzottius varieornatus]|uniref:Uncharacterized protein n=1 Tax=Ramazzottius varieornatus TaxID=947166 RepID=A0A1D1VEX7_RAMVA|nr:hypothetical protein RvY_08417 [Ramazzottius varieornatus]
MSALNDILDEKNAAQVEDRIKRKDDEGSKSGPDIRSPGTPVHIQYSTHKSPKAAQSLAGCWSLSLMSETPFES